MDEESNGAESLEDDEEQTEASTYNSIEQPDSPPRDIIHDNNIASTQSADPDTSIAPETGSTAPAWNDLTGSLSYADTGTAQIQEAALRIEDAIGRLADVTGQRGGGLSELVSQLREEVRAAQRAIEKQANDIERLQEWIKYNRS